MLTYNHESYIEEAIKSVLNQTYKNWELIIVDNASTDKTRQIIEQLTQKDSRIKFFPQIRNLYVSHGINTALKYCKGEYIALLSGDDYFKQTKLELQLEYMITKKLDLSFTWINVVNEKSEKDSQGTEDWLNDSTIKTSNDIVRSYFHMNNKTCAPTALIKSTVLNNMKLHDHRLLQIQDLELWIRILQQTQNVEILHIPLTNYRISSDGSNLSSQNSLAKENRTVFEMMSIYEQLFLLDDKIISDIFDVEITSENKHQRLYEIFENNNAHILQYTSLIKMFEKLGPECDTSSPLFQFFFQKYSEIGITDINIVKKQTKMIDQRDSSIKEQTEMIDQKDSYIKELETKYDYLVKNRFNIFKRRL